MSGKMERATVQLQEGPMPCCLAHLDHRTCSQPNEQYWWQLIQAGGRGPLRHSLCQGSLIYLPLDYPRIPECALL